MRLGLALFLFAHGIAHLVGFVGSWRLSAKVPYKTTLFADRLHVGDAGIRAVGVLWLLAALAFALVATGALLDLAWWRSAALAVSVGSLAMCVASLPEARIGVLIDLALIGVLLFVVRPDGA